MLICCCCVLVRLLRMWQVLRNPHVSRLTSFLKRLEAGFNLESAFSRTREALALQVRPPSVCCALR